MMPTWIVECHDCHAEVSRHDTIEAARRASEAHAAPAHVITIFYRHDGLPSPNAGAVAIPRRHDEPGLG
jgi:hypothetical protein